MATNWLSFAILWLSLMQRCQPSPPCREFSNQADGHLYIYNVCTGTQVREDNASSHFCWNEFNADLVTFPTEEQYRFITTQINATLASGEEFLYFPGFYQRSNGDKWSPETGEFYWVDDPATIITANSSTYWQPFRELILEFGNQPYQAKQSRSFVLGLDGDWFPGVSLSGGESAISLDSGNVVCSRKHIATTTSIAPTTTTTTTALPTTTTTLPTTTTTSTTTTSTTTTTTTTTLPTTTTTSTTIPTTRATTIIATTPSALTTLLESTVISTTTTKPTNAVTAVTFSMTTTPKLTSTTTEVVKAKEAKNSATSHFVPSFNQILILLLSLLQA